MTKAIGSPIDRVDARAKVTGTATYAAEVPVNNIAVTPNEKPATCVR